MERVVLKFLNRKAAGNVYDCIITEALNAEFGVEGFKICRNNCEPLMRLEYSSKSIGDFMLKVDDNGYTTSISKASIYMGNVATLPIFNTNRSINKLYSIMKSFEGFVVR